MNNKINILIPGSFKPVHGGHIELIRTLLNGYDGHPTNVDVIISNKDRDGISAQSTLDFMSEIFSKYPNFHCMISPYPSPIYAVYNMTATKFFGDGIYAMGSSYKENDINRQEDFVSKFEKNGKYYTPGVTPMIVDIGHLPSYKTRQDELNHAPISASIVRIDLMNDDYTSFLSAYDNVPDISEDTLERYYDVLLSEIKTRVNETSIAGHINHPYDDNDLTFGEIKDMVNALFSGKIENIEEKIDGINILASMDLKGNVIFARNKKHLTTAPLTLNDIVANSEWNDKTKASFTNGAKTIEKVFKNISNGVKYFNGDYEFGENKILHRKWLSIEIYDSGNMNVIPYVGNFISFHKMFVSVEINNGKTTISSENEFDELDKSKIENAIHLTDLYDNDFSASMTPTMVIDNERDINIMLKYVTDEIDDLMNEYGLSDDNTIADYKYTAFRRYIEENKPIAIPYNSDVINMLSERWSGRKKVSVKELKEKSGKVFVKYVPSKIREFEKNGLQALRKRVMMPLDRLFINIGNTALDSLTGAKNGGNEKNAVNKIKDSIVDAISDIRETGDLKDLCRLEGLVARLDNVSDIKPSEGIVFRYNGRFYKLTGVFPIINQIVGIKRKCN